MFLEMIYLKKMEVEILNLVPNGAEWLNKEKYQDWIRVQSIRTQGAKPRPVTISRSLILVMNSPFTFCYVKVRFIYKQFPRLIYNFCKAIRLINHCIRLLILASKSYNFQWASPINARLKTKHKCNGATRLILKRGERERERERDPQMIDVGGYKLGHKIRLVQVR